VRNRPLNFIAGNRGISLGTPVARNPCTSSGDSRVSSACSSAGVDVTLRCIRLEGCDVRRQSRAAPPGETAGVGLYNPYQIAHWPLLARRLQP
jgi:hypothetical protein